MNKLGTKFILIFSLILGSCSYVSRNQIFRVQKNEAATPLCEEESSYGDTAAIKYGESQMLIQVRQGTDLGFFGPPLIPLLPFPFVFTKPRIDYLIVERFTKDGSKLLINNAEWKVRINEEADVIVPEIKEDKSYTKIMFPIKASKIPERIELIIDGVYLNGKKQTSTSIQFKSKDKWIYEPFSFIHPRVFWPYSAPYPCR